MAQEMATIAWTGIDNSQQTIRFGAAWLHQILSRRGNSRAQHRNAVFDSYSSWFGCYRTGGYIVLSNQTFKCGSAALNSPVKGRSSENK